METTADRDNFLQMIQENKGIIIKICNSYCKTSNDREDLAQEIIYHLWKSGKSFNQDYKFSTWMYRIALNVAISFYRREKKTIPLLPISEFHINIEEAPCNNEETERNIQLLQRLITEMKELDKALLLLWFESKSYADISEILGITETNVATKLSRIKDRLKQQFGQLQK